VSRLRAGFALAADVLLRTRRGGAFWAFLALSALIAGVAVGGLDLVPGEQGGWRLSFFFDAAATSERHDPIEVAGPAAVYAFSWELLIKQLASLFGVGLGLLATSQAVASAFEPGRAELILPRPIARGEVVAARFAGALAFAALQASWFCGLIVVLAGVKLGVWVPRLLLVVPPLLLKFAVLAALTSCVAVVLRSRTLALAAAAGAWLGSFVLNAAREQLEGMRSELVRLGRPADEALGGAGPWLEWAQRLWPQVTHHDLVAQEVCYQGVALATFDPATVLAQGLCWTIGPLVVAAWVASRRDY
jgi:hypothetical protein